MTVGEKIQNRQNENNIEKQEMPNEVIKLFKMLFFGFAFNVWLIMFLYSIAVIIIKLSR